MTSLIATLATLVPSASASDTAIRRIRIEEARAEDSLRTIVRTESASADPGSLTVTVQGLDGGAPLDLVVRPKSTSTRSTAGYGPAAPPTDQELWLDCAFVRGDDPTAIEQVVVAVVPCDAGCEWQEASLSDGSGVRVRTASQVDADGSVVLTSDVRWRPGDPSGAVWTLASATYAGGDLDGDGAPDPLGGWASTPMYETRWVTTRWSTDDAAVQIDATLTAADGTTDAMSDLAVLALEGSGLAESSFQPRKRKPGYKATFITVSRPEDPVVAIEASVRDDADTMLGEVVIDHPVESVAVLAAPLGRGPGGDAVFTLGVTDADGTPLVSESFAMALAEGAVEAAFAENTDLAVSQAAIVADPDGQLVLLFALTGALARGVEAADVGIATADAEDYVPAALTYRLDRWTAVVDPGVQVDAVDVTATLRGADGAAIDAWTYGVSTEAGGIALRTASIGGVNNNGMTPQLKLNSGSF